MTLGKGTKSLLVLSAISLLLAIGIRLYRENRYDQAVQMQNEGLYKDAQEQLVDLGDFRDAGQRALYNEAMADIQEGNYREAREIFKKLEDFENSEEKIEEINALVREEISNYKAAYRQAVAHYESGEYRTALVEFRVLGDYKNSQSYIKKCTDAMRREMADTISVGSMFSVAIAEDGLLFTGYNVDGQDDLEADGLISVSAGGYYAVGLYEDGSARIAGDISWLKGKPENNWENVLQVAAGFNFVAALFEDGTVETQGYNAEKGHTREMDFSEWQNIIQIDAGYQLVGGLDAEGHVHLRGHNASKIMDDIQSHEDRWTHVTQIAVGGGEEDDEGYVAGLRDDGTVVLAGKYGGGIDQAENWTEIKDISAGDYHLVGLIGAGKVVAAINRVDTHSDPSWDACCDFSDWPEDVKLVAVAAGNETTLGLSEDGVVYSSGYDLQEQIPEPGEWKAC